jgi:CRISPR-associated protein Cas2
MSRETLRWRLISFDVRDTKRYRQVTKIIKGVAVRVQYSVFRARLDDRETERLRWELSRVMAPKTPFSSSSSARAVQHES